VEGTGPLGGKHFLCRALRHAVWQRELQVLGDELLDVWTADIGSLFELDDLEDVDRPEPGSMPGGHILIECLDGFGAGKFTIFLVHVVGATARIITDPDTKVLDFQGPFLVDLIQRHDFTIGLLDFPEFLEEVPETGLGDYRVWGKQTHTIELGSRIGI